MKHIRIYPSRRFCLLFGLAGLWFVFTPVLGTKLVALGYAHMSIVFVLFLVDAFRLLSLRGSEIKRETESIMSVGIKNSVKNIVNNKASFPVILQIRDEYPADFTAIPEECVVTYPGQVTSASEYWVIPPKRGDYRFGMLCFRALSGFGLAVLQATIYAESSIKVYPDISQTRKHALLSKVKRTREMGLRNSRLLGQGREFERLRDYMPDDEMRLIDWNATARRARLTTREFDIERNQQIMIMLDIGRTMASRTMDAFGNQGPTKADLAINAAVLLSYAASQWDDRIGLCCFAEKVISYVPPGKGKTQSARIMDELYLHQPRMEESNYYDALMYLSGKQRKRCMVFLLTDLIDVDSSARLISAINLISKHHLTVCVALSDYELNEIVEQEPVTSDQIYGQAVALNIIRDRKSALKSLTARGVVTVDASPEDLNVATVNKYLQMKREGKV